MCSCSVLPLQIYLHNFEHLVYISMAQLYSTSLLLGCHRRSWTLFASMSLRNDLGLSGQGRARLWKLNCQRLDVSRDLKHRSH